MAASDPQDSVTLVKLVLVETDQQRTLAGIRLVKTELSTVGIAANQGATAGAASVNQLTTALNATASAAANAASAGASVGTNTSAIDAQTSAVDRLRDAFAGAADTASQLDQSGGDAGVGGLSVRGALRGAGAAARLIPGGGIVSRAARSVGTIEGVAESAGVGLETFGLALGGVGAVALAVTAIYSVYNAALEANKEKVKNFAAALDDAFGAGTTGAINALKQEAEARKANAAAVGNELVGRANAAPTQLDQSVYNANVDMYNFQASILGVAQATKDTRPTYESYLDQIQKQRDIVTDADTAIAAYNVVLDNQKTSAANAAELIQTLSDAQLEAAQFAATATTESLKKRQDASQLETQYLQAESNVLAAQHTTEADKIKQEVDARILLLKIQGQALDLFKGEIEARDALNQALGIAERNSKAVSDNITKYVLDTKKANEDIAKLDLDHAAAVTKINQDAATKAVSLAVAEAARETAIQSEANVHAAALGEKYGIEQKRAQEDLQRELAQLRAQEARDLGQAEQNRNAVEFDRVKSQEQLTESKDKENARVAAQRREQDYRRELVQLAKATQDKLVAERDGLQKSLQLNASAASAALTIENNKYTLEITKRQAALDIMAAQYNAFIAQISGAGNAYKPPNVLNGVNYTTLSHDEFVKWEASQGIQVHATGDLARYTGLHYLEKGERVLSLPQTAQYDLSRDRSGRLIRSSSDRGSSGVTIYLNAEGMANKRVIATTRKEAVAHLDRVLREAGV